MTLRSRFPFTPAIIFAVLSCRNPLRQAPLRIALLSLLAVLSFPDVLEAQEPCSYNLTANKTSFTSLGGSGGIGYVVGPPGCYPTLSFSRLCAGLHESLTSDQPWLTKSIVGGGCAGVFDVAPYSGSTARRLANISAHGKTFQISQTGMAGADFNKDDHPDVIFQDQASGWTQVWFLGGTNGTTILNAANLTLRNTWRIAAVADFNHDSHPDIVWQDPASGAVQVWLMTGTLGTQIGNAITLVTSNSWRIVAAADFNQDGHADLLWQDPLVGISEVWLLGGAQGTTVVGSSTLSEGNTWRIAAAADLNSDGRTDVMWQNQGTGFTQIWFLGGSQGTTVTAAVNLVQTNPWRIAATGDLNRDGRPDLIWQDPVTGASQAWMMGGAQGNQILNSITLGESNSWRIAGPR